MRSFHHRPTLFIGVLAMLLGALFVSAQEAPRVPTETTFQKIELALGELEESHDAAVAAAPIARAKRLLTEGRLQAAAGKLRAAGFTADRLDAILALISLLEQNAATSEAVKSAENEITASAAHLDELKEQLKSLSEEASTSSKTTTNSESNKAPPPEAGDAP